MRDNPSRSVRIPHQTAYFLRRACLWAVMCLCGVSLSALDPQRDIHQFAHRSWLEKDGYPGQPQALAQTTDGFLWIGTFDGLYRFDGVQFERYRSRSGDELPDDGVLSLLALPDGSLWIGFSNEGKISVLRNGNVTTYVSAIGLPKSAGIFVIIQDHEGTMWANTGEGLIRLNGTRWERIGSQWGLPQEIQHSISHALFVDSHGILWAGIGHTVMHLRQGSKRFEPTGAYAGYVESIAEAPDGKIWMADESSATRVISTSVSAKSAARARCEVVDDSLTSKCPSDGQLEIRMNSATFLFDRDGSLWINLLDDGLRRVSYPQRLKNQSIPQLGDEVQSFTSKDGLSADNCISILEDREGNI